jgi:uncharacterized membrane protein
MADIGLSLLLSWHIASMIIWLGSSLSFAFIVYPSISNHLSKEDRITFFQAVLPLFSKIIGTASVSTILAGILLFGYVSSVDVSKMPVGWNLIFISLGAVLGLVGIILTLGVIFPMAEKITKALHEESNHDVSKKHSMILEIENPGQEMEGRIQALYSVTRSMSLMLLIVVGLMILGVYF